MEDEIDYGELFGVTPDGGGQEPAGAAEGQPAGTSQDQEADVSNSGTEGRMPAEQQEPAAPEGAEQAPEGQESTEQKPQGQLDQDRGQADADAQARAQYEAAGGRHSALPNDWPDSLAAVQAKAQADAQRTIDEAFARSGLKNPYTGAPITTKAEYDAYRERFENDRREKILKQTGMSGEEFQQFVQGLPEVQKVREAQEKAEKAVREAREAAARVKVEEQLREIGQLDPSIKSLEDLAKMPTYPQFYELVKRGNTLTDAFRLANFDALTQSAAAGARQAAVNAALSKGHMEQTRSRGKGGISVPPEVKEQYLFFNPGATDEEIQKHYQKNHKEA